LLQEQSPFGSIKGVKERDTSPVDIKRMRFGSQEDIVTSKIEPTPIQSDSAKAQDASELCSPVEHKPPNGGLSTQDSTMVKPIDKAFHNQISDELKAEGLTDIIQSKGR